MKAIGLSGSLRSGSTNAKLLKCAAALAPANFGIDIASIAGISLYDADIETKDGVPKIVEALKNRIAAADALLLVTPEYNNSIPGVFKNAIDWLSRPASDIRRVFGGKPVGVIGASAGGFGSILGQQAWLPVLRYLGTDPWFGASVTLSRSLDAFGDSGDLIDEKARKALADYLSGFASFVESKTRREG